MAELGRIYDLGRIVCNTYKLVLKSFETNAFGIGIIANISNIGGFVRSVVLFWKWKY